MIGGGLAIVLSGLVIVTALVSSSSASGWSIGTGRNCRPVT
jgi:hypothetical protein